jgi:hypothetical protein
MSKRYELVRNLPFAKFYYAGSHSHPVRREILVFETSRNYITGYELREGNITRDVDNAPIKTYTRTKIATRKQCRSDSVMRKVGTKRLNETTLVRTSLTDVTTE